MKRGQRRENEARRESCQPSNISLSAQPWPTLIIQNTHATERRSIIVIYLHAISDKFETNSASCKAMPPQITFAVGSIPQNFERVGSIHWINFCEGMRCFRWANFMARNSIMYFTWQKLLMLSDWRLRCGQVSNHSRTTGLCSQIQAWFESGWLPAFFTSTLPQSITKYHISTWGKQVIPSLSCYTAWRMFTLWYTHWQCPSRTHSELSQIIRHADTNTAMTCWNRQTLDHFPWQMFYCYFTVCQLNSWVTFSWPRSEIH